MAGAMVVARVVMKQKCGAEEIIDHCARNLAPYKVPRRIEFSRRSSRIGRRSPIVVDHDELACVVTAEARVEIVLRCAHTGQMRAITPAGSVCSCAAARTRRVVDRERHELVAVVRAAAQARLVRAAARHAHEARALAARARGPARHRRASPRAARAGARRACSTSCRDTRCGRSGTPSRSTSRPRARRHHRRAPSRPRTRARTRWGTLGQR